MLALLLHSLLCESTFVLFFRILCSITLGHFLIFLSFPICLALSFSIPTLFSSISPGADPFTDRVGASQCVSIQVISAKQLSCDLCDLRRCLSFVHSAHGYRVVSRELWGSGWSQPPAWSRSQRAQAAYRDWRHLISGLSQIRYKQCWFTSAVHRNRT